MFSISWESSLQAVCSLHMQMTWHSWHKCATSSHPEKFHGLAPALVMLHALLLSPVPLLLASLAHFAFLSAVPVWGSRAPPNARFSRGSGSAWLGVWFILMGCQTCFTYSGSCGPCCSARLSNGILVTAHTLAKHRWISGEAANAAEIRLKCCKPRPL